jgi:hypothetical protein
MVVLIKIKIIKSPCFEAKKKKIAWNRSGPLMSRVSESRTASQNSPSGTCSSQGPGRPPCSPCPGFAGSTCWWPPGTADSFWMWLLGEQDGGEGR